MKTLLEYINETRNPEALQRFMLEYNKNNNTEGIKEYFEKHKLLEDDKIYIKRNKNKFITLDDFKFIYEYANEYNLPCPVIVDYKNKPGHFVFRRWVNKLNEHLDNIDLIDDIGAPYMGLHNTSMKEDGKWFPNSEDMELIIAYGYNKINGIFTDDIKNISYVMNKEFIHNSKAEQLMEYYVANNITIDNITKYLPNNLDKLKKMTSVDKVTNGWVDNGNYNNHFKPNTTPKTDLISNKYHISLKKHGGAQLMSGYENEAKATLISICKEMNNDKLLNEINSLFTTPWLRNISSEKEYDKRESANILNKNLTKILNNILDSNKEFKRKLIVESITGEIKFGKNSMSCANYVFVWDDLIPENSCLYSINEYVDNIIDTVKASISLKTANKTSTALRLITK